MRISHISSRFLAFAIIFVLCATYAPHAKSIDCAWWKDQAKKAIIPARPAVVIVAIAGVMPESKEKKILKGKDNPPPIIVATLVGGFWGAVIGAAECFFAKGASKEGFTGTLRGAISGGLAGAATRATVFGIIRFLKKKMHEKQPTHENSGSNPQKQQRSQ